MKMETGKRCKVFAIKCIDPNHLDCGEYATSDLQSYTPEIEDAAMFSSWGIASESCYEGKEEVVEVEHNINGEWIESENP